MRFWDRHSGSEPAGLTAVVGGAPLQEPFDVFYLREYQAVLAVSYALSGSWEAAQDVAHDAFAGCRRRWGTPNGGDPEIVVLHIAARTAGSMGGRLAVAWHGSWRRLERGEHSDRRTEPAERRFWNAVRRCRPRQAQALTLHYLRHCELVEMADILGCSPSAVDRIVRSGQSTLRRRLRLGDDDRRMASADLEPLDSDGQGQPNLEQLAQAASANLIQAAYVEPPPLHGPRVLHPRTTLAAMSAVVAVIIAGAVVLGAHALQTSGAVAPPQVAEEAQAIGVVSQLASGNYRAVSTRYPPASLPRRYPLQIKDQWQHCLAAFGSYRSRGRPNGGVGTIIVPVMMSRANIDVSVNFDQTGHVSVFGCTEASTPNPVSLTRAEAEAKASEVVAQLRDHNYQAVIASLNRLQQTYIDTALLQSQWQIFERAYGEAVGQGQPVSTDIYGIDVPVTWARASSHVLVYFDGDYQVGGLSLLFADAPPVAIYGGTVAPSSETAAVATSTVDDLAARRFTKVADNLDLIGAAMTDPTGLQKEWQNAVSSLGRLQRVGPPVLLTAGGSVLDYLIELRFDHGPANVQVYVDAHNRILEPIVKTGPATGVSGR